MYIIHKMFVKNYEIEEIPSNSWMLYSNISICIDVWHYMFIPKCTDVYILKNEEGNFYFVYQNILKQVTNLDYTYTFSTTSHI